MSLRFFICVVMSSLSTWHRARLGGGGGEAGWAAVKLQGSGASRPGGGFYRHQKVLKANICLTHKVVVRACGFWVVMCVVNYRLWTDVCQLNELIHCHLSLRSP